LTLFRPINFLRLQLQNNSALDVEVNPEAYSCTLKLRNFEKFDCSTFGDDILISTVATSPVALRWMCDSPRTGCARRTTICICGANKQQ